MTVFNLKDKLTFGKHKGSVIENLLCHENGLQYLEWCEQNIEWLRFSEEVQHLMQERNALWDDSQQDFGCWEFVL